MKRTNRLAALALLGVAGALSATEATAQTRAKWASPPAASQRAGGGAQHGLASWYGPGLHGRRTASGERFNAGALTAAHRTLPFGARVRVVNRVNRRSVVVRINDRGPFAHGRIIDLSQASARAIGAGGLVRVALIRH